MTKKFERVEMPLIINVHIPENEILLSFYDDYGALAFDEWWREYGAGLFGDWCGDHPDYSFLMED